MSDPPEQIAEADVATLAERVLIQSPVVADSADRDVARRPAAQFSDVLFLIAARRAIKRFTLYRSTSSVPIEMASQEELRRRYYQMIDSGEFQFPASFTTQEVVERVTRGIRSVGQEVPPNAEFPAAVDIREVFLDLYLPIKEGVEAAFKQVGAD